MPVTLRQLLRAAFEVYGEVTDAFVAYNGRSSRGFGYVTFKEDKAATKAVRAPRIRKRYIRQASAPSTLPHSSIVPCLRQILCPLRISGYAAAVLAYHTRTPRLLKYIALRDADTPVWIDARRLLRWRLMAC